MEDCFRREPVEKLAMEVAFPVTFEYNINVTFCRPAESMQIPSRGLEASELQMKSLVITTIAVISC